MLRAVVACDDFVGRREELAFLHEEFAAARDGRTRFVPIEGEAGIGKSRVAAEFFAGVAGQATVRTGHCSEHVRTPYHPFATVLPARRGSGDKAATFEAAVRWLTSESAAQPLVLAIEDVQWADSASIELLQYLIANLRDARVLVLLMMRTESSAEQAPLAALRLSLARARAGVLRLHGLRRNDVRRLVERIAAENEGSVAAEAVSQIETLSEGNPLFVEELARVALETGGLDIAANVPLSIQAMLAERLAPFSEDERALLVRAAIVGQRFDARFLATIADRSFDDVLAVLQRATDAGLVSASAAASTAFAFRHALIRQALEDQLILGLAAPLHVRIAQALEAQPDASERAAELAFHWSAARVADRARYWNERAAEAAAGVYAYRDAVAFYSAALRWEYPAGRARALAFERLGTLLYIDGCGEEPAIWFDRARAEYEALGDDRGVAHALLLVADQYWVDARTRESLAAAERAVGLVRACDDPELEAEAYLSLARFSVTLGNAGIAAAYLRDAERLDAHLTLAQRASFHEVRAETHAALGAAVPALTDCAAAARLAGQTGSSELIAQVENNVALVAFDLGEIAQAIEHHRVALAEARRTSMPWRVAYSALNYASTLFVCGDLRAARGMLWTALETGVATATFKTKAASVGIPLALLLDDRQLLRSCADDAALQHARTSGEIQRLGSVRAAFAELRAAQGDAASSGALLEEALRDVRHVHRCWYLAIVALRHGSAAARSRVPDLLARSQARPRVLRAFRTLARARLGSGAESRRAAEIAARAFAAMGAERYERISREAAAQDAATSELPLSPRQAEIARLVAAGETNKGIAARLHISENTVEHHLSSIFARLGVRSRSLLAARVAGHDGGNPGYRP